MDKDEATHLRASTALHRLDTTPGDDHDLIPTTFALGSLLASVSLLASGVAGAGLFPRTVFVEKFGYDT